MDSVTLRATSKTKMSEYWKSTPRIWCKHCKTFYRDTPFDTRQHNNTGKHQSAIQRSIRHLHKDTEREERDSQRAKAEVARLNGLVSGKPVVKDAGVVAKGPAEKASEGERKRQIAQLAALGVAVPEEYRKEMAVAGEWSTVKERRLQPAKTEQEQIKQEDASEEFERSVGVRKRKAEDDEEDESAKMRDGAPDRRWGSRMKTYKVADEGDVDIGALLGKQGEDQDVKEERAVKNEDGQGAPPSGTETAAGNSADGVAASPEAAEEKPTMMPSEENTPATAVLFKKRKNKSKRGG